MSSLPAALSRFTVLDLTRVRSGPTCVRQLADWGANVIKIEMPDRGESSEGLGGPRDGSDFMNLHRNKRSMTLDLKTPEGVELLKKMVAKADVLVENFRPDVKHRLGIDYETMREVNPRLVLLRSSGFGQSGPSTARAAFNPVGLAFGGMTYLNGWPDRPPVRDGVTAGDYSTALFNVLGIVAALLRRDLDGEGQIVDTAMYECALRLTGDTLAVRSALGIRRERAGGGWPVYPSSLTVEAADGRCVAVSSGCWDDFADALERLGRPRVADPARVSEEVAKLVSPLAADEAVPALRRAGLAASAVNSVADLVREPHLWSRGDLVRCVDPDRGEIVTQGIVPLFSRTPGRLRGWPGRPGSDNDTVLGALLGYTPEQVRRVTSGPAP